MKIVKELKCHIKKPEQKVICKVTNLPCSGCKPCCEHRSTHVMVCPTCNGSGIEPDDWRDMSIVSCHQCNGSGKIAI